MFTTTFEMKGLRITLSFFNLGFDGFGFAVRLALGFESVLALAGLDDGFGFAVVLRRFLFGFSLGLSLGISRPPVMK
jgi:hypothetical protein